MAKETELKLLLQPDDHNRLDALMQELNARPQAIQRLENIYFDTPDFDLNQARAALRLRFTGKEWLQTLKTSGTNHGALSQRGEWEMPVKNAALQPELLPQEVLTPVLIKALQPQFTTHFTRRTWLWSSAEAEIEIAADLGEVALADGSPRDLKRKDSLSELELELKQGDPQALFDLAKILATRLTLHPGLASKAERGLRLIRGARPAENNNPVNNNGQATVDLNQLAVQQLNSWIQAHENWAFNAAEEELHHAQRAMLRLHALLVMQQRLNPAVCLGQARIQIKKLLKVFNPLVLDSWRDKSLQQLQLQEPAASWRVQQLGYAARRASYRQIWQELWVGQATLELMQTLYTQAQRPAAAPTHPIKLLQAACAHLRFPRQPLHCPVWLQRYPALVRLELLIQQVQPENTQDQKRTRQLLQGIERLSGDVALQQQTNLPQSIKEQLEQQIKTQLLDLGRLAQALWTE
ncbi:MAG: CYTH domain-containing protein [Marinospirillum sp.]|uniref:CYTH domain-containing protein n=1 Tax=Marinospirillum sp. TaxID=2183934 RepID=UPI001A0AB335|nr:CYTH domain-containing protein [Marinospirillum sp.]MBE0507466.1 CYTH domain-containing protein [Marinospirillum sp.]